MNQEDQEFIKELCGMHREVRLDMFTMKGTVDQVLKIRRKYGEKVLFAYIDGFNAGHKQAMDKVQSKLNQFKEAT